MTICMSPGIFMITAMGINDTMNIMNPLLPNKIFTWWFLGILIIPFSKIIKTSRNKLYSIDIDNFSYKSTLNHKLT